MTFENIKIEMTAEQAYLLYISLPTGTDRDIRRLKQLLAQKLKEISFDEISMQKHGNYNVSLWSESKDRLDVMF